MALMERLVHIDTHALQRVARRGLVRVLRWTADRLREPDATVVSGAASADAAPSAPVEAPPVEAAPAEPPPAEPPHEEADEVRHGAAAWVDAQQAEREDDDAGVSEAALVGALSGDFTPAFATRAREATEQDTGDADVSGDHDPALIHDRVIAQLHTVFDPEIPVDIYDLGLIYGVEVREDRSVFVTMTLTSPNCPAAQSLPSEVEVKVGRVPGVTGAEVDVVFDPPWTPDLMSDEAKLELNIL